MPTYEIDMYTGSLDPGAFGRTGANVYLTLYGTKASSGELLLANPGAAFRPQGRDTFSRRLTDLGVVQRLHVRHGNTGLGPGWLLDRITIRNLDTQQEWTFPCNRWLALDEDDGEIERTLDAA